MRARRSAVLLLLLAPLFWSPRPAYAVLRVVFVDKTSLDVEDAWQDDKYVHFVYRGRRITVLRSDVSRIDGSRPEVRPPTRSACPAPRLGDDDQAVRGYFRCLGAQWVRTPVLENGQQRWVYEGLIGNRLEHYVVMDGRVIEAASPARP